MSVKGKSHDEWVAATYTNFGDPNRKEVLRHHFTEQAAYRAWNEILKVYGGYGKNARIWQETRGGEILNERLS